MLHYHLFSGPIFVRQCLRNWELPTPAIHGARLLRLRLASGPRTPVVETAAPWCSTWTEERHRAFPHFDMLTPGLYYDQLAPFVERLGRSRILFLDMAWIRTGDAMEHIVRCLGLPQHAHHDAQLVAPSGVGMASSDSGHAERAEPRVLHFLRRFYATSNRLTLALTGVGADWLYPSNEAENRTAEELQHHLCRKCVVNSATRMTTAC